METANVNLKNWKSLIKPGKLDINLNDDKSYAKIVAEPCLLYTSPSPRD